MHLPAQSQVPCIWYRGSSVCRHAPRTQSEQSYSCQCTNNKNYFYLPTYKWKRFSFANIQIEDISICQNTTKEKTYVAGQSAPGGPTSATIPQGLSLQVFPFSPPSISWLSGQPQSPEPLNVYKNLKICTRCKI